MLLLTGLITAAVVIVTVIAALPLLVAAVVIVTVVTALLTIVVVRTVLLIGTVSVISVSLLLLLFVSLTGIKVVVTRNFVAHFGIRVCAAYRTAFPDTRSFSFFFVAVHKILLD